MENEMQAKPQCSGIDSGSPCVLSSGHAGYCMSRTLVQHDAARIQMAQLWADLKLGHAEELARAEWERS